MNGVIIVDKPAGWTSHDVVNRMRRILGQRSVGHLGTLDPLATGVLPLVTGSLTRLAQFYTASEKTYEGVIRFGFATTTYDADGDRLEAQEPRVGTASPEACPERSRGTRESQTGPVGRKPDLDLETLRKLSTRFLGVIEQVPPPFSAKKIHGVPAYKLARKHKKVIHKPVQIEIKEFEILKVEGERAHFRARVSSGTYMRSVAHEMGQLLGSGAHLESLRRTSVAEFDLSHAHTLIEVEQYMKECSISAEHINTCNEVPAADIEACDERIQEAQVKAGSQTKQTRIREFASEPTTNCHSGRRGTPSDVEGNGGMEEPAVSRHEGMADLFIHPRQLLPQFPSVTADEATAARIRAGRTINLPELSRARQVKVFQGHSELIAIATRVAGTLFHPGIVFVVQ